MILAALIAVAPVGADPITDRWVVPPVMASGTALPSPPGQRVRWTAERLTLRGDTVINDGVTAVTGRLTGTFRLANGRTITKQFPVQVLGRDATRLVVYTRQPTDAHAANQPLIARSIHFALARQGAQPVPLFDDYGTVFAQGDYIGIDRVALRGIADPAVFHLHDGSIGIIARRVDMAGVTAGGPVVFRADTRSPADFVELGAITIPDGDGATGWRAVWDAAAHHYIVSWQDRAGAPRWATVRDLAKTDVASDPLNPANGGQRLRIATAGNVGPVRTGAVATVGAAPGGDGATALPISPAVATALTNRFGRIVNIAATVPPQAVRVGGIAALAGVRARLTYSDGSIADRPVDWNPDDLRTIAAARSGTFTLRGTIRQRAYPQIFAYNRADPAIYRYARDGRTHYLFVATDDTNNGNVASHHLPIRVAETIAGLADDNGGRAREVDLLNRRIRRDRTAEGRVIAGCYWAPELHEIAGRLTILFAPCFNPQDDQSPDKGSWRTVEAHMMQLRSGGDPANPADWSQPAAIRKADGSPLGRPEFPETISLDLSYFTAGTKAYYIWSQRYRSPAALGDPLTWIAQVDPSRPTRLLAAPRPIIAPTLAFEENLSEGGFVQRHDGRIHLIYSGSGVSPTYVVGGVWASEDADLTRIDSWHKWTAPLQKSQPMPPGVTDYRTYEQGPGHGSFTNDEDGVPLYVYHSWGNGVGGDGRDTRVRRLHWAADGRPVLDMAAAEEVAPANRTVTTTVTVRR